MRTFVVTLEVPAGSPSPIAPGVFVVHSAGNPLFSRGQTDRDQAPRQSGPDTGPAENVAVSPVSERDSFSYGRAVEVTIEAR